MDFSERLGVADHGFRLVFGRTKIDYDPQKEAANRAKHGYSLESAVDLLQRILFPVDGRSPAMLSDPFEENGEVRHMHVGVADDGKVVFMVTTMRPDETVRVVSFRRANESERELFRSHTGYSEPGDGA